MLGELLRKPQGLKPIDLVDSICGLKRMLKKLMYRFKPALSG
jgi:hypothetical protein